MLKTPKRKRNHVNPLSYTEEIFFSGFDNSNPIIMDIGSYRGEFGKKLVEKFGKENKENNNQKNFIFTEIRIPYFKYLEKLFEKNIKEDKNVQIFGGNSAMNMFNILKRSIKKGIKIEKIFINFPDPWFKKKHKKRRVLWGKTLDDLEKWLPKETEIIFQTDQENLFKETVEEIKKRGFLKVEFFSRPLWDITTYWENMKTKEGKKIWRMKISIIY